MLSGNPIHSVSSGRISALLSSIKKSKKVSFDMAELENINPNVYKKTVERQVTKNELNEDFVDQIDSREVFGEELRVFGEFTKLKVAISDLIRNINDPEHPLTLEELHVLEQSRVTVDNGKSEVFVQFTPTIPVSFSLPLSCCSCSKISFQHCSMATLIGLSIRVKLIRALPPRFKIAVEITPGTHSSENAINKQLKDKERVAASLENSHLMQVVNECISNSN
jgi:Iron-sulfur cluster assembly protein